MNRLTIRALTFAAPLAVTSCVKPPITRDSGAGHLLAQSTHVPALPLTSVSGNKPAAPEATSTIPSKNPAVNTPASTAQEPPAPEPPHDPLLDPTLAKSCGPAEPNPHGYLMPWARVDGTCHTCPSVPKQLAVCDNARKGHELTQSVLSSPNRRTVRLRGSLGFFPLMCTKMGGYCACNNSCSAFVRLGPANANWKSANLPAPTVILGLHAEGKQLLPKEMIDRYVSSEGPLVCMGDDASLCCPFEVDHESLKVEVVVSGVLDSGVLDEQPVKFLKVIDICRVVAK